ncbi:MAG: hypothetical protein HC844_21720, partial [Tabrizicola sp.]|nr:hypothetical protein [Tabrizicola sp.]
MRLTLELMTGPETGAARIVDGSRTFSVGNRPGATWYLSGAGSGAGDGILRIRHERNGFLAEAEGDVAIEGAPAGDGKSRSIGHGSRFTIAGIELRATIAQTAGAARRGPGRSGAPTVTAILADVTPGGDLAQGLLPGRTGEEWLDELTRDTRPAPETDWSEVGRYGAAPASPLRAPLSADDGRPRLSTYLPEDWDAPSDSQNRVTQFREPAGAVPKPFAQVEPDRSALDPAIRAFLRGADILPEEIDGPIEQQMAGLGELLRALHEAIDRIEMAQSRVMAELETPEEASLRAALRRQRRPCCLPGAICNWQGRTFLAGPPASR